MVSDRRIYRIKYMRPWGECTVNTAQFNNERDLRVAFAKSHKGCEILSVFDVTESFYGS